MQTFNTVAPTDKLQDSLTPIMDRDTANRSNNAGTAFPTTNLYVGMQCWRSDTAKMYVLTATGPDTWAQVPTVADGDARYLQLTGGTITGVLTVNGGFKTGQDTNMLAGQFGRYSAGYGGTAFNFTDTSGGANAPTFAAWQFSGAEKMRLTNAGVLTVNAQTVWTSGNDGATSGLDADLLDGQQGSYYLAWANLTGVPAFTDAATTTVAVIRAGVDLGSRVSKSGDTMTGGLGTTQVTISSTSPTLTLADTDGLTRNIANDGGIVGVMKSAGGWALAVDDNGRTYSGQYGWLDDYFAARATAAEQGGSRSYGNCGDTAIATGYEVYDVGDGRHQVRYYAHNCTNCNCNCNCGGG